MVQTGGGTNNVEPVLAGTAVIDLNQSSPTWRQTAAMQFPRFMHNLVMLPDGKVLAVGGSMTFTLGLSPGALPTEMWDPLTETWTPMAAIPHPRMYHSFALLRWKGSQRRRGAQLYRSGLRDCSDLFAAIPLQRGTPHGYNANGVPSTAGMVRLGGSASSPTISIADAAITEGNAGTVNAVFHEPDERDDRRRSGARHDQRQRPAVVIVARCE